MFRETAAVFRHFAATEKDEAIRAEFLRLAEQIDALAAEREKALASQIARNQSKRGE